MRILLKYPVVDKYKFYRPAGPVTGSAIIRLLVCPIRKPSSVFIPRYDDRMAEPGCYFSVSEELGWGEWVGIFRIASLEPVDKYKRVVCFRSHDDYHKYRMSRQALW